MHGINFLFDEVEYDGLWIDMNEATGFCNGECPSGVVRNATSSEPPKRSLKERIQPRQRNNVGEDKKNETWYNSWSE